MMTLNPSSKLYRLSTIWDSFKALYRMSPQQVDAFLKAYDIYDCDWKDGRAVRNGGFVDYREVKEAILAWYTVLNHLCAIAEVEKMYIPPTLDPNQSVIDNQTLFEESFCRQLGLKSGDKVFELGCGKGRVAAHVAAFSGADITAINIDQGQLDNAKAFAEKNGLSEQCHFINQDLNGFPFAYPDEHFDAIYEIQALSLCHNLDDLFQELARILKPGGKLSILEWVRLPKYDPNNPHHQDLMRKIKPLIGAIGTPSPQEYEDALTKAGFEVIVSQDPSVNQSQGPLIDKAGQNFDLFYPLLKALEWIRVIPNFFSILFKRIGKDVEALCEADRAGLVTTSYHIVAQKR